MTNPIIYIKILFVYVRQRKLKSSLSKGGNALDFTFNDIHSHVIPCIDDGSKSLGDSLDMLRTMEAYGTQNLILTPHYSQRRGFTPDRDKILSAAQQFKADCKDAGIGINLFAGCEIEYSSDIPEMLADGKLVPLAGSECVLIEFAPYVHARDITAALREIVQTGYVPVIAHIERYPYIKGNIAEVRAFKHLGARIQVNLHFVVQHILFADKFLKSLLSERLIDFIAGDIHWEAFSQSTVKRGFEIVKKHGSEEYAEEMFFKNAEKILLSDERNY